MTQPIARPTAPRAAFVPDTSAEGLVAEPLDRERYRRPNVDQREAPGLLASLIPPGSRVLDVGCGGGAVTALLAEAASAGEGGHLVGVEPDEERAAAARRAGFDVVDGVLRPELLDQLGRFDRVVLADVVEHVPEPAALVRLASTFLAPNGRVLLSIPNVAHWTVRRALLRGRFDYTPTGLMDATHLRWFTRKSVRALVDAAGLEVTAERYAPGASMAAYRGRPWRWIPSRYRRRVLARAAAVRPTLFALQFVVEARPAGAPDVDLRTP